MIKRALAVLLLSSIVLPVNHASAQTDQWNALYDRIIRLEAEVRQGGGSGGAGNGQLQAQLQQLSAQMNAMAQQMQEMQRELNRLRELERQGLLFRKNRVASVISPQQQPNQWEQGQVVPQPGYGTLQQSVEIEGQPGSATGRIPQGGLAPGPQVLGTLNLGSADPSTPPPIPPAYQAPQPQVQPQPQWQQQPLQPQAGAQPSFQAQPYQPRQVEGVQSSTLEPIGGAQSQPLPQPQGQAQYQLQQGAQPYQPEPVIEPEPGFDEDGRPSLVPEKVETALLDGSTGGSNLGAGSTTTGGVVDDSAGRLFQQAQSSYRSRDFSGAVTGFKTFITQNKDHELADDAQFLLGEAYYAQGNWKQAAQTYISGYQNYPKSDKRGSSLLKLAMSLNKLGQKKQACATFAEVNSKFASETAVRNTSIKEMQRAGCS